LIGSVLNQWVTKMSLMKTLAKVAIGMAVAKGASTMMQKRDRSAQAYAGAGLGRLFFAAQLGQSAVLVA
jgi:hypothetical protein